MTVTYNGASFEVNVPEGIAEGDVFVVLLPAQPAPSLPSIDGLVAQDGAIDGAAQAAAALSAVLDALEDNDDSALDRIIDDNCAEFAEWTQGSEARLEWTGLFEAYVTEAEGFIGEMLATRGCNAEDVFLHAQAYSGGDARVRKLIDKLLAMAEFEQFCKMMRDRHEVLQMFDG